MGVNGHREEEQGADAREVLWRDRKHFMWFPFSFTRYEVRNNRLYTQRGLLSTTYDEVLLYRILDISMRQTLAQKLFGTGTLILAARANMDGDVILENIKHPREVNDLLSELVEKARDQKRVVGKEFYGSDGRLEDDELDLENGPEEDDRD